MLKAMITIGIVLFCVIPFYNNGNTHSGGLDQNGGHWDRKKGTYHYHRQLHHRAQHCPAQRQVLN